VELLVPPSEEQARIVAAIEEQFSRLDAGVAALERVRQNLKRMRAAVLQAAVTGRLVTQDASERSGKELLVELLTADQQPQRSRPPSRKHNLITVLPKLPSSWAAASWMSIGRSQNGRAFPSIDYSQEGAKLLRPGNLNVSGQVAWTTENTRYLPEHYAADFPDYLVGPHEIVMNLTAQSLRDEFLGRVCMTGENDLALLNQRIARIAAVGMNARFVFWVLKSPIFRRFVDQLNTGSLIQHMFTSQLDEFVFPIPPLQEQDRIVESIDAAMSRVDHLECAVDAAEARMQPFRSSILAAAFSGKLVPQDPTDEPASVLLERIAAERAAPSAPQPTRKPRQLRLPA